MAVQAASSLDTAKFRKVHSLMTGGATPGERSAAKARAEAMAIKAGMSLKDAVSSLDAKPKAKPANFFDGFDDWCEEREPGHKAREAAKKAERDARDAVRKAEVLAQYGSEAALFARTEREALLDEAIAPLVGEWDYWADDEGNRHRTAEEIDGHRSKWGTWYFEDITPAIRDAVSTAYPWPSSLSSALRELQYWDRLRWDRGLLSGGEWNHYPEVSCRVELLEYALKCGQPAATWEDLEARFAWKRYDFSRQWIDPQEPNDPFTDRVEADIAVIRQKGVHTVDTPAEPVQTGHRTRADKQADVLSMLDAHPELSDREIARRLGVSPQTVNTWRKKR